MESLEAAAALSRPSQASYDLAQRHHVHLSLLETEMSPHLFLELPKSQSQRNLQLGQLRSVITVISELRSADQTAEGTGR